MSGRYPRDLAAYMRHTSELSGLPHKLVAACRWIDQTTGMKQHYTPGRSVSDLLEVARDLLSHALDPHPESGSPYALRLRADQLADLIRDEIGTQPTSLAAWDAAWERFTAALALSVSDVMRGRECDLGGRLVLWSPPVRRPS